MSFVFKYQSKELFYYRSNQEDLTCPYCNRLYEIINQRLRALIIQQIHEQQYDLPSISMRCIYCDLYNDQYPFKMNAASEFQPNAEQKNIIFELYQQILLSTHNTSVSTPSTLFLVEGYAGTGKTSIITYFLKYTEFSPSKICFSAPTNKALHVLMDKLNDQCDENEYGDLETLNSSDDKNWVFKTVFKLLNNKMTINSQGETLFDFKQSDTLKSKYDIIVIDEVSMVEKQQLEHILNLMTSLKRERHLGGMIPMIIFLGDVGQLPPIGEDSAIIFETSIQTKYQIKKLALTEIMRSQNKITELSLKIRALIPMKMEQKIKQDLYGINLKQVQCLQIGYFADRSKWINDYAMVFKKNLSIADNNKSHTAPIILVYTNAECETLNTACRNLIFNQPEEKFVKGELLVFSNYYCLLRKKKSGAQKQKMESYYLKFYTSEPIIVETVQSASMTIEDCQFTSLFISPKWLIERINMKIKTLPMPKNKKDHLITEIGNLLSNWAIDADENTIMTHDTILDRHLNKLIASINRMRHTYDIYQLGIDGRHKLDSFDSDPNNCQVLIIKETSSQKYLKTSTEVKAKIKSCYETLSGTYKNNALMKLLIDCLFQFIWLRYYYGQYIWPFAEIVYGYAITIYKSQGSTYFHIYVDLPNILGCKKVSELIKAKSLYTAATRASHHVNIYYQKPTLLPFIPADQPFKCHICDLMSQGSFYPPINCTIDKQCADKILNGVKAVTLYQYNATHVVLSDKNKNLYLIPLDQLSDVHINDAYDYIATHHLIRDEINKYLYSNLILATNLCKINL